MDESLGIAEVTAEELYREIRRGEPLFVLDVRNEDEFSQWRIEGLRPEALINLPYFAFLEEEQACLARIPRGQPITVVCAKGGSSAFVAGLLGQHGIQARNLRGGMLAWGDLQVIAPVLPPDRPGLSLLQVNRVGKRCLSYLIACDGEAIVVDPSRHIDWYRALLGRHRVRLTHVMDTHLHADHLSGGPALARLFGTPYHICLDDAAGATYAYAALEDGTRLALGSSVVEIIAIHTPGHTPGSTSLLIDERYLLTGDTLFVASIGRPDLGHKAEEWAQLLYRTLFERMAGLPDEVLILPAHYAGMGEMRQDGVVGITVGEARRHNPALQMRGEREFLEYVLEHLPPQPPVYRDIRRANLGQLVLDEEQALEAELGPNQCAAALPPRG
jgi:glyoxylase-like metal-dependent hydrolase (beta-lactamase superfamily II)/rhodanese-related sulfurtransferase